MGREKWLDKRGFLVGVSRRESIENIDEKSVPYIEMQTPHKFRDLNRNKWLAGPFLH